MLVCLRKLLMQVFTLNWKTLGKSLEVDDGGLLNTSRPPTRALDKREYLVTVRDNLC